MYHALLMLLLGAVAPGANPPPPPDHLFVINSNDGNIMRVLPTGELAKFSHIEEARGLGAVGFTVDAHGALYVSVPDRTVTGAISYLIYKVDPDGKAIIFASGFPQLAMLAFDSKGMLYAGAGSSIYKITPTGTVSILPTGIAGPSCMTFAADGTLYVADVTSGTIDKVNPDTGASTPFVTGLDHPEGLAFDPSGDLFVAEIYTNKILRVTSAGIVTKVASLPIPRSLAFDQDGDLFITCEGVNAVYMMDKSGAVSQVVHGLSKPLNLVFDHFVPPPTPVIPAKRIAPIASVPAPPPSDFPLFWVLVGIIPLTLLIILATFQRLAKETKEN